VIIVFVKRFHFNELESTQQKARELLEENKAAFFVVADKQTLGKGTKGRSWYSPQGGLYMTIVLELDFNILKQDIVSFSEESCLLIVETLKDFLVESFPNSNLDDLKVKPINDLYFKEAKLAGILLESINKNKNSFLLVGIGLNIKKNLEANLDKEIVSLEEILEDEDYRDLGLVDFSLKLSKLVNQSFSRLKY
jgi:BirA family biotin operon repressor/biotin-[acetyl-CoA-carboxylase] ligase